MVKPSPKKPFPTVPKSQTNRGAACMIHFRKKRMVSIPEIKRVSSFPDDYLFVGDYFLQWERIGNSIPPLFMRSIADHIKTKILTNV